MTFPLPDGCRVVCRKKRSTVPTVDAATVGRIIDAALRNGTDPQEICDVVKKRIACCCDDDTKAILNEAKQAALDAIATWAAASPSGLLAVAGFVGPIPEEVGTADAIATAAGLSVTWWALLIAGIGVIIAGIRALYLQNVALQLMQKAVLQLTDIANRICEETQ